MRNWTKALCLALLLGASPGAAQERETFTFTPPERQSEPDARRDRTGSGMRDIVWQLEAQGDWAVNLEGQGRARITGDLIRAELEIEGEDRPLRFFVQAGTAALGHVRFSQTGERPLRAAGLAGYGSNYLTRAGRGVLSLGADAGHGYLANHDGFVRVDRREDALAITFSIDAVNCAPIREAPFVSQPPCNDGMFVGTRPEGRAQVRGCIVALDQWRASPGACDTPFQVDAVTPEDERENVHFDEPRLSVTFSEPVRLDTLAPAFTLYTLAPDGGQLPIGGEWTRDGASRYRFVPEERLYSGTIYRAQIDGGRDGVESQAGGWLEEPYEWSFSTQLDLAAQAPPDDLPVRLHNFQVVRDGELTAGKPTLTRAYFNWARHEDVAEDMQPESFRFRFETSVEYPRWVGQHGALPVVRALRIWRHDDSRQFDETDRRLALHTANFFGWRPAGRQGFNTLEFHLEPHDPFPSTAPALRYTAHKTYAIWDHDPAPMVLHYSFAQVGAWRDGVPAAERALARQIMQAMRCPPVVPHS